MDIGFALNYAHVYEIDVTPNGPARTWAWLAAGVSSIDSDGNEEVSQDPYYDGGGQASSDVTGGQEVVKVSGHRKYGDPAQDYMASLKFAYGEARKSNLRITNPDGEQLVVPVTIANIKASGAHGDANAKNDFEVELHFNGMPRMVPPTKTKLPESVSVPGSPITVQASKSAKVSATVVPADASDKLLYAVEDDTIATVDADGNVKGVKQGQTRVSVKCAAKPSVSAVAEVKVTTG